MAITLTQKAKGNTNSNQATSDLAGVMSATTAGTLIVVGTGGGAGTMTITGVADGGDTFVQAVNAAATEAVNGFATDIWYCLSGAGGKTNITATFSAANTNNKDIWMAEFAGFSSCVFDLAGHVNNGLGVAGTDTGAAVTTTGATGALFAVIVTANAVTGIAGGNEFTLGDITTTSDASAYLISASAASHQPAWADTGTPLFASSTAAFKEAGGGGGGFFSRWYYDMTKAG